MRDKNLYKSCILFTEFNSPPNLVRDKGIYSTRAGSILASAGPAWDLRVTRLLRKDLLAPTSSWYQSFFVETSTKEIVIQQESLKYV
jgi:hypothetical protein